MGQRSTSSVLKNYGQVHLPELITWIESYIETETRTVQDGAMLFTRVFQPLSKEGLTKICARTEGFKYNVIESGTLLLKLVLAESGLQT